MRQPGSTDAKIASLQMAFIDCALNPSRVDEMVHAMASWLESEPDIRCVELVDEHSAKVWELFERTCKETTRDFTSTHLLQISDSVGALTALEALELWESVDEEDRARVKRALTESNTAKTEWYVRVHGGVADTPLVVRIELTDHAIEVSKAKTTNVYHITSLIFRDNFGVTNSEARVLEQLLLGLRPTDIASAQDRSVDTIRNHIKSLMSKVGVFGNAELLAQANSVAFLSQDKNRDSAPDAAEAAGFSPYVRSLPIVLEG